ncbi:MAG TPA: alpha/beta hydrolase [Caldimonas sp.]|nr:alpha/beta hydrolase [Caldimonas sp.]
MREALRARSGDASDYRELLMRCLVGVVLVAALVASATPAVSAEGAAETHRYLEVNGSRIYVETFGSGAPLVFLHGGLLYFDNSFAKQKDYFATKRKVIGIDRPGHGHSPDNGRPFTYQAMADDMAAVIEQLGIGPVDVVGHSDGGNVGLILAHDHPQLVRRLVISGANLTPGLPPDELQRRSQWSQQQLAEKVRQFEEKLPPNFRLDYQAVAPDGAGQWEKLLLKSYPLWLTPVVIEVAALKSIQTPVLVIAGDKDFTSIEETVTLYRSLPKGQLLIVPGTGHMTFSDRADLTNQAISEFLGPP